MKKKILMLFIPIIFISNLFSQVKTDVDLIKDNTFYFKIEEGNSFGEGFDILKKEICNSQFVILGEEHFSAKVSEFTNSIIPALSENGFKYFAAEIGSNSANIITELIKNNENLYDFNTRVNNLVGEIPIPFFDGEEDEVFLKSFLKNDFEIWGLDQEYLTSQVFLIDRLYQLSNKSAKLQSVYLIAKEFIISETKKGRNDKKYKVFTTLLNSEITNGFFEKLNKEDKETSKIISDLKKSWEIYSLREKNDLYGSIHERLKVMQDNFISNYNRALKTEKQPKVFMKIGGVHASKGRSHHNIYDIGNFLMELANFNDSKSVHILIFPSAYLNNDGTISENIEKEDEQIFNPVVDFESNKWTLIDLRSIEKSSWNYKIQSESLKDYMYRFDYIVLTPASKQTKLNYKK
ncbi:hypothetical protein Q763_16590 [Flavobacterium beibuense F44-8]|uniref:Haem-binding uptake Tiki superfamily ChaN domain-containing protein n=1 Tax=Flavobacterium beibuense F44-8 TaxID=1406840 RepID=A0A0A2LG04_9FLAO|nr:hypothetical protein [Flavobacterium beibuense]KGO78804.1 hypothetical protein Q763_16590 [Flavobacterium beibuense F44-8]